jgi:general L-amino acid transport system substrate-binding protein
MMMGTTARSDVRFASALRFVGGRAMRHCFRLVVLALTCAASLAPAAAQTLKSVKDHGALVCGVNEGLAGFGSRDAAGNWSGFDVDFCRAIAAAIFNDKNAVTFVPLSTADRFTALASQKVDILSRNSTWTMLRDSAQGIRFPATTYYDGQAFLVPRAQSVNSALELNGAMVCVQSDTTTELNLADYFKANKIDYQVLQFPSMGEAVKAYESGRCRVLTSDSSQLYAEKLGLLHPSDHIVLPEVISKEPLGPAVRDNDAQWFNLVRWIHFAMVNAEELGISSRTIDTALSSDKPDVKRLVGTEGDYGEPIGLTKDWAARAIRLVGNYAEVFDRNVGSGSKLGIPRGLNDLWSKGGIQYAPPIR